jgi:hypothetical protein
MISPLLRAYPTGRWRRQERGVVIGQVRGRDVRVTRESTGYTAQHLWGGEMAEATTPEDAVAALMRGPVPA